MWQLITREPVRGHLPIDVVAGSEEGGAPDTTPITTKVEYAFILTIKWMQFIDPVALL